MLDRVTECEGVYLEAKQIAENNGMAMSSPSDGVYQLRHKLNGWAVSLYPRRKGYRIRAYYVFDCQGPFVKLPFRWTLVQAVQTFADAWSNNKEVESELS